MFLFNIKSELSDFVVILQWGFRIIKQIVVCLDMTRKYFRIYKKLGTIFGGIRLVNTILSIKSSLKNKTILNLFFSTHFIHDLLHRYNTIFFHKSN